MREYLRITGNENLARDLNTGAIINTNVDEFESYKRKINASLEMKRKLQEQETEIAKIKSDISEIKELLYRLLETK